MTRIKQICLMMFFIIILLPAGKSCYAKNSYARHLYKKAPPNKVMIINDWETIPPVHKPVFIASHMDRQPMVTDKVKYAGSHSKMRRNFKILQWDLEVKDNTYHIYVNRYDKTVTVGGVAEDREEKEKVEHIIELRAPDNFDIINKIEIYEKDLG